MYLTSYTSTPEPYFINHLALLHGKSPFERSSGIHSTSVRHNVFSDNSNYGKLRKGFIRSTTPGQPKKTELEKIAEKDNKQDRKKNISVNVDEESLEKGLLEYFSTSKSLKPNTSISSYKSPAYQLRAQTSSSQHRMTFMSPLAKSMGRLNSASTSEGLLRRDIMCTSGEVDRQDFADDYAGEKYQNVLFINAPSKEYLKLLKLGNFDVTLVPSDSRRVIVEAIMRDYFLNLITENSDFLICKNTQTQIYAIVFTGRLVPTCKKCTSVAQFELSKDLGFRVVCSSKYCSLKVLYRTTLSNYTIECLWPTKSRPDVELSVRPKEKIVRSGISRLIQSGKFKKADFSRVFLDQNTPAGENVNVRPSTTANIMRTSSSVSKLNRVVIKSDVYDLPEKQLEITGITGTGKRPNTVQGLVKPFGSRPGTGGSIDLNDFKGLPILKELEPKGLFVRDKDNIKEVEDVIEEIPGDEEIGHMRVSKITEEPEDVMKTKTESEIEKSRGSRPPTSVSVQERPKSRKERIENIKVRFEPYAMQLGKKLIARGRTTDKFDNSFDDIHNMVTLMSSKDSKVII